MRDYRSWTAAGATLALSTLASSAAAAPPGGFALSVERLFGFGRISVETKVGNLVADSATTSVSLFGTSYATAYAGPRLGLDYLMQSGLSVGGALSFQNTRVDVDTEGLELTTWIVAPRVGYFTQVARGVALWPRGGITHRSTGRDGLEDDSTLTALTLEVPVTFLVLADHVGLFAMPHLDFGVAGGTDSVDQTATELGILFGTSLFF